MEFRDVAENSNRIAAERRVKKQGSYSMKDGIFRKKSMDRVKSPDQLNDYIRVSNPGVWLVLAAVIILLIGICVWGVFGKLDTKVSAVCTSSSGVMTCYVRTDDIQKITSEMKITVEGKDYEILSVGNTAVKAGDEMNAYLLYLGGFSKDEWVCEITAKTDLPDGDYAAEIVVESISPMFFVLN